MTIQKRRYSSGLKLRFAVASLLSIVPATQSWGVDEKRLSFYHTHTHKALDIVYARGSDYLEPALREINGFLSDFRTGDVTPMDPELMDILYDLQAELGSSGTYQVISAYRSPKTNEMLRNNSGGVAKKSQHLRGRAIDVRLTDVDTAELRDVAIGLRRGGVGYYQSSDFVHIDTGRVRRW